MSHDYYNELWLIAREDLEKLLKLDQRIQEARPIRNKPTALDVALGTYLKYRNLVKRLVVCYEQMIPTQKRELIKRVLDCAIGRMLEYKRQIVNMDYSDYQWPDNLMIQLKYTPDDIEIFAPVDGKERLEERKKFIQELLDNAHKLPEMMRERSLSQMHIAAQIEEFQSKRLPQRKKVKTETTTLFVLEEPPEEKAAREARLAAERAMQSAVLLIQSHERARVDRSLAANVKELYEYNKKVATREIIPRKVDKATYRNAAVTIQRAWRRYTGRKDLKKRIAKIEEMLGMTVPSWQSREVLNKDEENLQRRLELLPAFAARTEKAISDERTRLLRMRGPGLMEDITDEIREWFLIWYNELGHFDVYPAAKLGGSVLIATGQTLTPQEYLAQQTQKSKQKGKPGTKPEEPGKKKRKDKRAGEKGAFQWTMPRTRAFSLLDLANKDFIENWSFREEQPGQVQQVYLDLITSKLCYELQLEMREIVDELMRLELDKLNEALLKDHADDPEKFAIPTLDKGKKKKGKKRGRRGRRRKKDDDVPIEDLFNELVQAKIIKNYPERSLKDWLGDLSYQNHEAALESRDYKHRLGEIKQVVMDYCVLPLTSKEVHLIAPMTRSVAICGLERSGKTFLANAICSAVGALLFDMTPQTLVGKYTGRRNERRLIDIISKVARVYKPSVIYIEGGEKPYYKKVPLEERYYQPKRFAPHYPKFIKSIKPGDQILFLTTSSEPYKATRRFTKIHDRFIIIPLTDYNSLYMYYKELLMKYHGVDRNIDVSSLAKMSVGVPLYFIRESVQNVLDVKRRIRLKFEPLNPREIMEEVMKYEFPSQKVLKQFDKFEKRTPLGRKRARMLAELAEAAKGKTKKPGK